MNDLKGLQVTTRYFISTWIPP